MPIDGGSVGREGGVVAHVGPELTADPYGNRFDLERLHARKRP
jgi:hypothetical protein